jgi:GT2 family glycosyltransferase/glycosyltransferase involved in cell wall biosynthesis
LIDVVIPVYGQVDLALRCIESVLQSTCKTPYQLIVIDDASPDPDVFTRLTAYSSSHPFTLLQNSKNLGFPETCNWAFALNPTNDVVLLNSDTVVFGDWLDRLSAITNSDASVGTVTPLTSNGTIAGYPNWMTENTTNLEISSADLDTLAGELHRGVWVEAPTGVGFCMLFTRACLNEVGYFDAETFGKGYGEENDFSQRALRLGWKQAITPSVFVHHEGGSSFGTSGAERKTAARRKVDKRYPGYSSALRTFVRENPLSKARAEIDCARIRRRTKDKAVLMVAHNWGGGTERHLQELAARLESDGTPVLFCRPDVENSNVFHISDPKILTTPNMRALYISESPELFLAQIRALGVERVHIHNLVGYSKMMPQYLVAALKGSTISYDRTAHDYQHWCPRINLMGLTDEYCGEPDEYSCQTCVSHLGSPFGKVSIWEWRVGHEQLLRGARAVFSPSQDAATRLSRQIPGLPIQVRPHESITISPRVTTEEPAARDMAQGKQDDILGTRRVRVGVIGAISKHKGSGVLLRVAAYAAAERLPLEFVVIGQADRSFPQVMTNVQVYGSYVDSELDAILVREQLDAIFFPAVSPETYSYTLTAALRSGLPIVAFDLGAIAERLRAHQVGTILPPELAWSPEAISKHLLAVASEEHRLPTKSHTLPYLNMATDYYGLPAQAIKATKNPPGA